MRNGATEEELLNLIGQAVQRKHPKHAGKERIMFTLNYNFHSRVLQSNHVF